MLPPGFEWRQMTLGMVSMISWMIWEKNKRRVYIITLALVGIYVARRAAHHRRILTEKLRLKRLRRQRTEQRNQLVKQLGINEVMV